MVGNAYCLLLLAESLVCLAHTHLHTHIRIPTPLSHSVSACLKLRSRSDRPAAMSQFPRSPLHQCSYDQNMVVLLYAVRHDTIRPRRAEGRPEEMDAAREREYTTGQSLFISLRLDLLPAFCPYSQRVSLEPRRSTFATDHMVHGPPTVRRKTGGNQTDRRQRRQPKSDGTKQQQQQPHATTEIPAAFSGCVPLCMRASDGSSKSGETKRKARDVPGS